MGAKQEPDREQVVVAAAVLRGHRVLAARRTKPAELAGRWEFPGGKVEAGETEAAALVRECREELGVLVRVLEPIGPEIPLPGGHLLRGYLVDLEGESAQPKTGVDHDALRWLDAEELDDVDWLEADAPLVEAVRRVLGAGRALPGGNVGGAVRVGETVRRPSGPWTPTVHALLGHVRRAGVPGVPEVLGIDGQGREMLSYVPGTTVGNDEWPDWTRSDALLVQAMRWLRSYHRAVVDFRPVNPRWRLDPRPARPGELICHNDVAPYNLVVTDIHAGSGPRLVGVVDWDVAGPGLPIDDVAFAAWNFVPLWNPDLAPTEVARKLSLLVSSYGGSSVLPHPGFPPGPSTEQVLRRVPVRLRAGLDRIRSGAKRGDPGMHNLIDTGRITDAERALAALEARLPPLRAALR